MTTFFFLPDLTVMALYPPDAAVLLIQAVAGTHMAQGCGRDDAIVKRAGSCQFPWPLIPPPLMPNRRGMLERMDGTSRPTLTACVLPLVFCGENLYTRPARAGTVGRSAGRVPPVAAGCPWLATLREQGFRVEHVVIDFDPLGVSKLGVFVRERRL